MDEFFSANIYLPHTYIIPHNDKIRTRKQKLNTNDNFFVL